VDDNLTEPFICAILSCSEIFKSLKPEGPHSHPSRGTSLNDPPRCSLKRVHRNASGNQKARKRRRSSKAPPPTPTTFMDLSMVYSPPSRLHLKEMIKVEPSMARTHVVHSHRQCKHCAQRNDLPERNAAKKQSSPNIWGFRPGTPTEGERRPLPGMLLHIDSSDHRWFQDERRHDLIVILDDAPSEIHYAETVACSTGARVRAAGRHAYSQSEPAAGGGNQSQSGKYGRRPRVP
jgi:hypothetical protein